MNSLKIPRIYKIEGFPKIETVSIMRNLHIQGLVYENENRIFVATESDSHYAWTEMYNNVNFYKWLLKYKID